MKIIPIVLLAVTALVACQDPQDADRRLADFDLQGHRGARGLMPENTIPGFVKALKLGVNTLELDVVISADSQIVVSHEPWMNPEICLQPNGSPISEDSGRSHNLFRMRYDEIAKYDCGSLKHPLFPDQNNQAQSKPRLRDVWQAVQLWEALQDGNGRNPARPVRFNIETKSSPERDGVYQPAPQAFASLLYAEMEFLDILDRVTIQSFDPRTLEHIHALDTSLTIALLVEHESPEASSLEKDLQRLSFLPDIFSPNYQYLNQETIREAQRLGLKVIPWTVNKPEIMQRMLAWGVDGLITDYPDRFFRLKSLQNMP